MDAPAFDTTRLGRPALLSIFLYLLIFVIASMSITRQAHASGTVTPTSGWCSNIYDPSTCIYATELEACARLASMQAECKYSPRIVHYNGTEIAGDACFANNSSGVVCFPSWSGLGWMGSRSVCPPNSTGTPATNPTSCTCNDPSVSDPTAYVPDSAGTSCVPSAACPAHASGTPCACDTGYKFDAAGTSCVSACTVDPLPKPPPPFSDACSNSLEKGKGIDVDNACAAGLTPDMKDGAQCVADKIHALAIPYNGPSATVRTAAYQDHLLAIWKKWKEIQKKVVSDVDKQACASVIANVDDEMKWHRIDSTPSSSGNLAPHVLGRAIDIPRDVIDAMMAQVTTPPTIVKACLFCTPFMSPASDVQDYINSATVNPPACNLQWGGRFKNPRPDPVHIQLP